MTSPSFADQYDEYYFQHSCGRIPYARHPEWLQFFGTIADTIARAISPGSVLDAGCAKGFLVEALRDRGVEAFGFDISPYAIEQVRDDIKSYCRVGSVLEPIPRRYDLITCIEVLEHLPAAECARAVENLCLASDDILFSSTPYDYAEVTHFNVQPPEYWAGLFAQYGFLHDVEFDASFVAPWTMRFRKRNEPVHRVVLGYERKLWQLSQQVTALRTLALDSRSNTALSGVQQPVLPEADGERHAHAELELPSTDQGRAIEALLTQVANRTAALGERAREKVAVEEALAEATQRIQSLERELQATSAALASIQESLGWKLVIQFGLARLRVIPRGSLRERLWDSAMRFLHGSLVLGPRAALASAITAWRRRLRQDASRQDQPLDQSRVERIAPTQPKLTDTPFEPAAARQHGAPFGEVKARSPLQAHKATADIIICVHNAPEAVRQCLESVIRYTSMPYSLILVDDASDMETATYLQRFAHGQGATLIRNEAARGYTAAANQGLKLSTSDYAILLNSDTLVGPEWLDRMIACAESDQRIGLVGPLSNTASWQSIPDIFDGEDWAKNCLPAGLTVTEMSGLTARSSARLYPRIPFLNGFCLMIRREAVDSIGYFDDETFREGYGEENDYCLRARQAGWELAIADDVYIYHLQSKSYSHERRKRLSEQADAALAAKYGQPIISAGTITCRWDRVLEGMRARSAAMLMRRRVIEEGRMRWEGKRLLFLLPSSEAGGGCQVVFQEAAAMQKMGVDVRILNRSMFGPVIERHYPHTTIPLVYAEDEDHFPLMWANYDAVVATLYSSVEWLDFPFSDTHRPIRGYYVQDFEPYFFLDNPEGFKRAWNTYTRYPDLVRITKTEWNRDVVKQEIGVDCTIIGPSVDIDTFRPRTRRDPEWPQRPLRIAAMIRPGTPRRQPGLTMRVLQSFMQKHGATSEVILFGCRPDDPAFLALPHDFAWRNVGVLTRPQLAALFNEVDIFVDFSSFQAMGLTAMEAMACGVAVIVPLKGGSRSFAKHEQNSLVVDTRATQACLSALERLANDEPLRTALQQQATIDICHYYPETPAYNMLAALFGEEGQLWT